MKHIKNYSVNISYPLQGVTVDVVLTIIYQILEAVRNFLATKQTDQQTTTDGVYKNEKF
ncbi:MAG: hypothetical protein N3G21_00755 [Candidatus Hydrogenedentes bacterium]|nr:hypothetical protein [Candidatus Hydrogenedentota bacterium]